MNIGIIGLGYWGPNLVRNFLSTKGIIKVFACDQKDDRLCSIKEKFPNVETVKDFNLLLKMDVDCIAIATPVNSHYELAKSALLAGKHIWVEKPFTSSVVQSEELIELAEKNNLKIFIDHTFIYTGAVKKIKDLVISGDLGEVLYFDSVRVNLGLFQHDVNVIWDLAPHDLSIMNYIIPNKKVIAVSANGIANYYEHENIAHLAVYFNDNCFAHFHLNWTSPVKIRRILIGGQNKMLMFDDMENSEKIKVYSSSIEISSQEKMYSTLAQYRIGDMFSPKVEHTEALALGAKEFISSITENRKPLTSGIEGLDVVKILEAAEKSIKNKGQFVEIK